MLHVKVLEGRSLEQLFPEDISKVIFGAIEVELYFINFSDRLYSTEVDAFFILPFIFPEHANFCRGKPRVAGGKNYGST